MPTTTSAWCLSVACSMSTGLVQWTCPTQAFESKCHPIALIVLTTIRAADSKLSSKTAATTRTPPIRKKCAPKACHKRGVMWHGVRMGQRHKMCHKKENQMYGVPTPNSMPCESISSGMGSRTSPPLTEVSQALRARNAAKVSKMSLAPEPRKVSKKSREQSGKSPESLRKLSKESFRTVPETFGRLFGVPGPEPQETFSRLFRHFGPEGPERPL